MTILNILTILQGSDIINTILNSKRATIMDDKTMYTTLFNAITIAIEELQKAQCKSEEMYISDEEATNSAEPQKNT